MSVPLWVWVAFNAFVLAVLALDLGVWHRSARVISGREAAIRTAVWVGLALLFAGGLSIVAGGQVGLTFLTGYVIEESLSADNVFVIVLIFGSLGIPPAHQHRVLFWGILGALVMRGAFIAGGAYLLARFWWVEYVLGVLLLVAAIRIPKSRELEVEGSQNLVLRALRRVLPVRETLDGQRFITRDPARGARWAATPLLVALVLIEVTDIAFAMDSIPAVFGITRDPFIVYASNVFAVLGLRSLYFLLAHAIRRFRYLPQALGFVLAFVGAKMLLARVLTIPTVVSLAVVLGALAIGAAASVRGEASRQ